MFRHGRWSMIGLVIAIVAASLGSSSTASAHHTGCYSDTQNPSPYGSFDKFARGSKTFRFYVPVEGVGVRSARVFFAPHIHGHAHSCLGWQTSVASDSMGAAQDGEFLYMRVEYWNKRAQQWVLAGNIVDTNKNELLASTTKLDFTSPADFTQGRVTVWYGKSVGGTSYFSANYGRYACTLGKHGQSSYSCA